MSAARREIEYYLPPLGMVRGTLFAESAQAYALLESMREIERLQRLNQLGAVRLAWAGARHTRWEFTVLCLELLRRAVALPNVPMTSKVRLRHGTNVSSYRELLQSWLLLLGVGHLEWTFTAERSLLHAVVREANRGKRQSYEALVDSVGTPDGRQWANQVLAEERFYQFYQLLAFYRIRAASSKVDDKDEAEGLLLILEAYSVERPNESLTLRRARDLFRRVRRLAFLALDSEFTPSVLGINLARVLNDQPTLERLLAPHHPIGSDDELTGIHRNLATRIYSAPEVMLEVARRRASLDSKIVEQLRKGGLRYVVSELAIGNLQRGVRVDSSLGVAARLTLDRRFVRLPIGTTVPGRALSLRVQEESAIAWANNCGARLSLEAIRDASEEQYILQMHSRDDAHSRAAAIVFCQYWVQNFAPLEAIESSNVGAYLIQRWVLGGFAEELLRAALQTAFGDRFRWEWEGQVNDLRAFALRRRVFETSFQTLTQAARLPRSRVAELEAVARCAQLLKAEFLIGSLANLKVYFEAEARPCAEVDGVVMGVDRRRKELVIQIVEAKNLRQRPASASRAALAMKMRILDMRREPLVRTGRVMTPSNGKEGRAWVYVRIPFGRDFEPPHGRKVP